LQPVTLAGRFVHLEPLGPHHADDLFRSGQAAEIWAYMPRGPLTSLEDTVQWIAQAREAQAAVGGQPFAVRHLATGQAIGSTRIWKLLFHATGGVEIGYTWLAPAYWRTAVNTECKYLLLRHAFEQLGVLRVQFMTDSRNVRSQQAIARLGAVKEGVLRCHRIPPSGYRRSSVVFSIIDQEWPQVKARLEAALTGA
jgi:RimJ/RimL family protein N-acetyltransferase